MTAKTVGTNRVFANGRKGHESETVIDVINAYLRERDLDAVAIRQMVDLKDLRDDAPYQNDYQPKKLREMEKDFDLLSIQQITIVEHDDGKRFILDGKHRVKLLLMKGYKRFEAIVIAGLPPQYEADIFQRLNIRRSIRAMDVYRSGLLGDRDPEAKEIHEIVTKCGWTVGSGSGSKSTQAVSALRAIHRLKTVPLDRVLNLCAESWPFDARNGEVIILRGVATFLRLYGDEVKDAYLVEKWGKVNTQLIVQQAIYHRHQSGGNGQLGAARALLVIYNKGLRSKLKWIDEDDE